MNKNERFKNIVRKYLRFLVAEDCTVSFDMFHDIIFTENLVSKELTVVENFSDRITENTDLHNYLHIAINSINLKIISIEDMLKKFKD
ncbi:hypothetical protein [Chryseobacterium caseinilyticum]|uniref:MafI family immunity protein n=1 Tax=Chryseobacterium caseinilyticum TaxID=2771428 RepID=A0ABR8ZI35_9FLAO|nr:hypothetical protein [Chryseobacterium caseinilyticum]MBD8084550.1 hypothetical protein [Chryseobacterium caseinilyticum]